MFDLVSTWLTGGNLFLFGCILFLLLSLAGEIGFRLGNWRRPQQERALPGVGTITSGMLALLAFTLGLTISFAQGRFEARRALVVQEANAIGTAWLRAQLIVGPESAAIAGWIEDFAKVRLAYTTAESSAAEPALIDRTNDLQNRIWRSVRTVAQREPTTVTVSLVNAVNDMFDSAMSQRFAYASRVPANLSWMLMIGSVLSIGAMGFQLGLGGARQLVLTSLLLVMWSGGITLITDLNRPRVGDLRVDPAPLIWTIQGFDRTR